MDDFHHHLLRLYGCQHVLAQGLCLDGVAEFLCYFVADIGVEQSSAHVLEGFGYVYFGDFTFTFENFERALKSLAEVFEHNF